MKARTIRPSCFAALAAVWLAALPVRAQLPVSDQLQFNRITIEPGQQVRARFSDAGTGATDFALETTTNLGENAQWTVDSSAIFTALGGGDYEVVAPALQDLAVFRIVGYQSGEPLTANFSSPSVTLEEGSGTTYLTLLFSAPFTGALTYTVSGTAGSGDFQPLSGSVSVNNATTAKIPITLNDDTTINQLKTLVLTLDAGQGVALGGTSQSVISIEDNDAVWNGSLQGTYSDVGIKLDITKNGGAYTGKLISDGSGLFPVGEFAAQLTWTASSFRALVNGIPIDAGSTLFNTPVDLSLQLHATAGQPNQSVDPTRLQGVYALTTTVPDAPQLNTTSTGTFLLLRPPVRPSTNQVPLVASP